MPTAASDSAEADGLLPQNSLRQVEGVRLREWDDALTIGDLHRRYWRAEWLKQVVCVQKQPC